eukprot:6064622-Amphidinium_carterae.1
MDSDRQLPDSWPPPASWRTALPPHVGTRALVPVGPDKGKGKGKSSQVRPGAEAAEEVPDGEGFTKEEEEEDDDEEDGAPNWG